MEKKGKLGVPCAKGTLKETNFQKKETLKIKKKEKKTEVSVSCWTDY